ncbi:MAG: hypothetical protein PVJ53_08840 [Desulfobacterales bacterium]|jgi:hypothetical protein
MKIRLSLLISVAFILIITSLAIAGHHYKGHGGCSGHGGMMSSWNMDTMDSNKNGSLTFDEYSRMQLDQLRAGFDMIDTNKDGVISAEEWKALLEVHGVTTQ